MRTPRLDHIYTGDALQLLPTWPNGWADVLVTDPPYGNAARYGRAGRRILGDEHPLVGLHGVAATYPLLKRNATAYVFCAAHHVGFIEHFFLRYSKFQRRELLVWDKRTPGFGRPFRRVHECILVLEKGKPRYRDVYLPTVLSIPRADTTDHPHAKPPALLARLIRASSDPGGVVLDPFAGAGSTAVAAASAGRRFVGIELDPDYAELARGRGASEKAA